MRTDNAWIAAFKCIHYAGHLIDQIADIWQKSENVFELKHQHTLAVTNKQTEAASCIECTESLSING